MHIKTCALAKMSNSMNNVNVSTSCFQNVRGLHSIAENLWKIAPIYFHARSVCRHSKMRENVAETADTIDIAPVGIDYGILAFFLLFHYFITLLLPKVFCQISVKNRYTHVQFYLRRVKSFCSADVRFHGNRKARYQILKIWYCPFFMTNVTFVL